MLHEEGEIGQALSGQTSYHLGAGIDALQRGQGLSYYQRDEQLSTALITGRDGEIQNSYLYDAFGTELEVNEQLSSGGLSADDLPIQYIVFDGKKVTMNNRSLTVLSLANMKPSVLVDVSDDSIELNKLLQRLKEMGGQPSESIFIRKLKEIVHIAR